MNISQEENLDLGRGSNKIGTISRIPQTDLQMQTIKLVIADDHRLFIEGLKTLLLSNKEIDIEIVGETGDGKEVSSLVRRSRPDVLILDLNMPGKDGLDVLAEVKQNKINSKMRIIALTMYDDTKLVKSAFKDGIDGYILKTAATTDLINAIKTVLTGDTFFGKGVYVHRPNIPSASVDRFGNMQPGGADSNQNYEDRFNKKHNLTKRELEILRLISRAKNNKEIAKTLFISDQTVSVHRRNLMRKLNVSSTAGLIKIAYDNSLV